MLKTRWKWLIGSLVALGLASAGTTCGVHKVKQAQSISDLDKRAEIHFAQAGFCVPSIVHKITQRDGTVHLIKLMARDKVFGTHETEDYLTSAVEPIMAHCREGAAVYGCRIDGGNTVNSMSDISRNHAKSAAYAAGGLALEAVFIKSTAISLKRVLGAVAARMAGSLAAGAVCSIADGPFPIGDLIGVVIAGVGTVWSISDLAQVDKSLPRDLTAALNAAINDCRASCRKAAAK